MLPGVLERAIRRRRGNPGLGCFWTGRIAIRPPVSRGLDFLPEVG